MIGRALGSWWDANNVSAAPESHRFCQSVNIGEFIEREGFFSKQCIDKGSDRTAFRKDNQCAK